MIGVAGVFPQTDGAEIENGTNSGEGFGSDVEDQCDIDSMRRRLVDHRDRICIKGE